MRKVFLSVSVVAAAFFFGGCYSAVSPAVTNVSVTAKEAKVGTAVCRWIVGLKAKDCSVDEAAKVAGITQIQAVETRMVFYPFVRLQTITVRGK